MTSDNTLPSAAVAGEPADTEPRPHPPTRGGTILGGLPLRRPVIPTRREPIERPDDSGAERDAPPPGAREPLRVVEPPQPRRIRRPVDLLRLLFGIVVIGLLLALGGLLLGTTTGLAQDVFNGGRHAPQWVVSLITLVANIAVVVVPVLLAISRLVQREGRRVLDGVFAAAISHVAALGANALVAHFAHHHITMALTLEVSGHQHSDAIHTYLVAAVAFVTVVDVSSSPRWQAATWTTIVLDGLAAIFGGLLTPLALAMTVAFGWTIANATRYVFGTSNTRPDGHAIVRGLDRLGLGITRLTQEPGGRDESRRYAARTADGAELDVIILDRDMQAAGVLYRIWRRLRVRGEVRNRATLSLRRALEHEALTAYAAAAADVRTPVLLGVTELGSEAGALAFEHLEGRRVADLEPDELTDQQMAAFWQQLARLHARRIAHRRLTADVLVLDAEDRAWLANIRVGEIAASELTIRLDTAQLLTTFALVAGVERAVAVAGSTLGSGTLDHAMPLLQPVALSRVTRAALRKNKGLLGELREEILRVRPQAEVEPVRLERIRLRTILTTAAVAAAVYLLLPSLSQMDLTHIRQVRPGWAIAALGLSLLTYGAATMSVIGFVSERLRWWRTFAVQVAGSFVTVVAPAAVGGVAVNTRFLQRSGIPPRLAVASVGLSQIVGLVSHIGMIIMFAFLAGTESPDVTPSTTVIVIVLVLTGAVLLVLAVGPIRRYAWSRVRPFFQGVLPRVLDVLQQPAKLATGLGGTWLLSLAYITCLFVCVHAFGVSADFTKVAVVFLAGQAVGSIIPTPGGIGGVESALTLGLTSVAGLDAGHAASAVLLFRLTTFWLPILPGWGCFILLQRKGSL